MDSRLLVRVVGCGGLVNRAVHGVANPYCRVALDAAALATSAQGDTTTSPAWQRDFDLPADLAQWARSSLRLEVPPRRTRLVQRRPF